MIETAITRNTVSWDDIAVEMNVPTHLENDTTQHDISTLNCALDEATTINTDVEHTFLEPCVVSAAEAVAPPSAWTTKEIRSQVQKTMVSDINIPGQYE